MDDKDELIRSVVNDWDGDAELIKIDSRLVITNDPELIKKYKNYSVLNDKQKDIVKTIAEKYPFNIETVVYAYINNKFSKKNTMEELERILTLGR